MLYNAPTAIGWANIPYPGSTYAEQLTEALRMCWRATHWIDGLSNQPLRATLTTESHGGPGNWRLGIDPDTGIGKFLPSRWPIINVYNGQMSPAMLPPSWTLIPINNIGVAGGFDENPAMSYDPGAAGSDSYAITIAPGWVTWPRNSTSVQMTYVSGWPHTSLTQACAAGDTTLYVDDVTGFSGLAPTIADEPVDEIVTVSSVTANTPVVLPAPSNLSIPAGAGTLTLASGTLGAHPVGTPVTTMPYSIQQAAILYCVVQALVRGATAVTAQKMPATGQSGGGNGGAGDLIAQAKELLRPFRRVV